jgi:2-oxoglutarate/2-oxoacid ferredoxin oxidoreductase subunit beta
VTFNDHEGSTKSYAYTREHMVEVVQADFVPLRDPIETSYPEGVVQTVTLHDGSIVKLRKVDQDYDATNRDAAYSAIREHQRKGEVMTGLLYLSPDSKNVHDQNETIDTPLYGLPHEQLCPGNDALQKLMAQYR